MGIVSKATAASKFETGDKPSQQDFADLIDSAVFMPSGIAGVIEVESTASATNRAIGAFGVVMLAAGTTASAQGHIGIVPGAAGLQVIEAGTTASAQGHLGAGAVGIELLEAGTTASAQGHLGAGAVGIELLEAITTASAVGHLGMISLADYPTDRATLTSTVTTAAGTIPANARRITVLMNSVSQDAAGARMIVQVRDSGGWKTSSYTGAVANVRAAVGGGGQWTSGMKITVSAQPGHSYVGSLQILLEQSAATRTYIAYGLVGDSGTSEMQHTAGGFNTTGAINQIRITTSAGTATLDNGSICLMVE